MPGQREAIRLGLKYGGRYERPKGSDHGGRLGDWPGDRVRVRRKRRPSRGLIGFTKTLSRELGEFGIRVNAILPGAVAGDRIEKVLAGRANASGRTLEEERKQAMSVQSLQRFVDPRDIAALALFVASDAGKSISGQLLPIDNDMQQAS